jgi:AraC-like DNA-binding protein
MVSKRCRIMLKEEMQKLGLHFVILDWGEVDVMEELTEGQLQLLSDGLKDSGLELVDNKKAILIEKIKNIITQVIHQSDEPLKINFSDYLSEKLNYNYTYLANLFSEVQGTTIEQYIIVHKVEYIKELMVYGELNLTEIAYKMNYSSVAHLSNQFKKVTGLSPSHFNKLREVRYQTADKMEMDDDL